MASLRTFPLRYGLFRPLLSMLSTVAGHVAGGRVDARDRRRRRRPAKFPDELIAALSR